MTDAEIKAFEACLVNVTADKNTFYGIVKKEYKGQIQHVIIVEVELEDHTKFPLTVSYFPDVADTKKTLVDEKVKIILPIPNAVVFRGH